MTGTQVSVQDLVFKIGEQTIENMAARHELSVAKQRIAELEQQLAALEQPAPPDAES